MEISYRQTGKEQLPLYGTIPMRFTVESALEIEEAGLTGIRLQEHPVPSPYVKDLGIYSPPERYHKEFDIRNWAFFMAFDGELPVGGATLAGRTPGLNMTAGREDLAVLWDLRVAETHRNRGIGTELFRRALIYAQKNGYRQLKIESQNNNVRACRFYAKQGATLGGIDRYAYRHDPALRDEIALYWYLDL